MIGVLALQGAFEAHQRHLDALGVANLQVRGPKDLALVDALVMPGGESTTMSKLAVMTGLEPLLRDRIARGMPIFGTCAGMILLASEVRDGRSDQITFGALDLVIQRNGYGRQVDSFETELEISGCDAPFHGVFIRAPKVISHTAAVEVLASHEGVPVLVRQGSVLAASFHPELTDDHRIHEWFVSHLVLQSDAVQSDAVQSDAVQSDAVQSEMEVS
jgi:pyridoxal 5'-phosphate synthase pdxT subunit